MSELRLIFYAIIVECMVLPLLFMKSHSIRVLSVYFLVHGFSSALLALGSQRLLPVQFRSPLFLSWLLIFSVAFFVPALGWLVVVAGFFIGAWLPDIFREDTFASVESPSFSPASNGDSAKLRHGNLKTLLTENGAPDALRIQGMLAIKDMPSRITGTLLRDTLDDSHEDLRLLSYGIMDKKEKAISQNIGRLLAMLERAKKSRRQGIGRRLAELYWELIYQDLVRGAIKKITLEKALNYCELALQENPEDAGMWLLSGRIYLAQNRYDDAHHSLVMARKFGASVMKVNPWLAEIALAKKQYAKITTLMQEVDRKSRFTTINPTVQYWSKHELSAS